MMSAPERLVARLTQAFLDVGFEQSSMSGLAKACGLTRRALYHHFSNKEEAFRFMLRRNGEEAIRTGLEAGQATLDAGGSAVEIVTQIMDVRYGEARRRLSQSPHATEVNDQAFRLARDIMVEAAVVFQRQVAAVIVAMEARGLLKLKAGVTPEALAQTLCDGARGTNQTLPPIPAAELVNRYRAMMTAILFGTTEGVGRR